MTAFVVQNLDDQKLLLAELKDKAGLRRINCVAAPVDTPPPMELPRAAQGAGIVCCISDVIEAPLQVKRYICTQVGGALAHLFILEIQTNSTKQFRTNEIFIGGKETRPRVDQLISAGMTSFFTDDAHYGVRVSKYGARARNVWPFFFFFFFFFVVCASTCSSFRFVCRQ